MLRGLPEALRLRRLMELEDRQHVKPPGQVTRHWRGIILSGCCNTRGEGGAHPSWLLLADPRQRCMLISDAGRRITASQHRRSAKLIRISFDYRVSTAHGGGGGEVAGRGGRGLLSSSALVALLALTVIETFFWLLLVMI